MLWNEEQRRILGLKPKEQRLLDVLHKKGVLNTVALAFETKIPRVTTMRLLKGLCERGFVARQTLRREVRYSLIRPELHAKRLQKIFTDVPGITEKNTFPLSEVASISMYRGAHELLESNKKFLAAHPGERLYTIEPNDIWQHVAKAPAKDWIHLNALIKQKNIQVESLVEEGFEESLKHIERSYQESFLSVPAEMHVIPKGFLQSSTEMLIFRDSALFYDWKQFICVEIKNPSTVHLLKGMFDLLKSQGRRA